MRGSKIKSLPFEDNRLISDNCVGIQHVPKNEPFSRQWPAPRLLLYLTSPMASTDMPAAAATSGQLPPAPTSTSTAPQPAPAEAPAPVSQHHSQAAHPAITVSSSRSSQRLRWRRSLTLHQNNRSPRTLSLRSLRRRNGLRCATSG